MKRLGFVGIAALVLAVTVGAAGAAPSNKNTGSLTGVCNGSAVTVTFIEHDRSVRAFTASGVAVAKEFAGVFNITFTVGGQNVLQFQDTFLEKKGSQGQGLAGRLVTCTFPETFVDPAFILTAAIAAELAADFPQVNWSSRIGQPVVVSGSGVLTVKALVPGS